MAANREEFFPIGNVPYFDFPELARISAGRCEQLAIMAESEPAHLICVAFQFPDRFPISAGQQNLFITAQGKQIAPGLEGKAADRSFYRNNRLDVGKGGFSRG